MFNFLTDFFGRLCGQNPEHTWVLGGITLPCCQRCLGIYLAAAVTFILHLSIKPRLTRGFLIIHGLFLLQIIPLGLYLLPQNPALRAFSGLLFGAGVVTSFWPAFASLWREIPDRSRLASSANYFFALMTGYLILMLAVRTDSRTAGVCLSIASFLGVIILAGLAVVVVWGVVYRLMKPGCQRE